MVSDNFGPELEQVFETLENNSRVSGVLHNFPKFLEWEINGKLDSCFVSSLFNLAGLKCSRMDVLETKHVISPVPALYISII